MARISVCGGVQLPQQVTLAHMTNQSQPSFPRSGLGLRLAGGGQPGPPHGSATSWAPCAGTGGTADMRAWFLAVAAPVCLTRALILSISRGGIRLSFLLRQFSPAFCVLGAPQVPANCARLSHGDPQAQPRLTAAARAW